MRLFKIVNPLPTMYRGGQVGKNHDCKQCDGVMVKEIKYEKS